VTYLKESAYDKETRNTREVVTGAGHGIGKKIALKEKYGV
jgi:hypothetical protein